MNECSLCGHEHTNRLDAWDRIGLWFGRTPRVVCDWRVEMWDTGCDCTGLSPEMVTG